MNWLVVFLTVLNCFDLSIANEGTADINTANIDPNAIEEDTINQNSLNETTTEDEVKENDELDPDGDYDAYFSAVVGMERLLDAEDSLLWYLKHYIKMQEDRLKELKQLYKAYKAEYDVAMKDTTEYLTNPINAFKVIKRLYVDWKYTEDIMTNEYIQEFAYNMSRLNESIKFPTEDDVHGAAEALMRLQELYKMPTKELADGKLRGVKYSNPMDARECFEVGYEYYANEDYNVTIEWMTEGLKKYELESMPSLNKYAFFEYLAPSYINIGNLDNAVKYTTELLKEVHDHSWAHQTLEELKDLVKKRDAGEKFEFGLPPKPLYGKSWKRHIYQILCRDEMEPPPSVKKLLKCRYYTGHHPFLKLAPAKLEEYYHDPFVAVFHDIIYDKEIAYIKEAATPKLKRAAVVNLKTGGDLLANYRVSKSGWLYDEENPIIKRLSQRTTDLTGFTMESAEPFQVANYGIGGHYEPHYDFSKNEETLGVGRSDGKGNRIATVLYYMSDVAEGGATVFPELGVAVKPRKGLALFWINLHRSGEGNFAALHGACPVLIGDKWVSNKWIRQLGQELILPCDLEFQPEGMNNRTFPDPVVKKPTKF